jgi:hypothetical protein
VLGRQRDTLADITREIPSSIMEAGHNTIEAIKRQTASLVEELRSLGSKIDQLSA